MNVNSSGTLLSNCSDALPSGSLQDFKGTYSAGAKDNGNVSGFTAVGQQTFNRSYTYDVLNRLQTMSAPGDQCSGLSWTIDPWGNRTAQTPTGGSCFSPSVSIGANNRLLGAPYSYDAAGNLLNDGNHTYTYDAEERITQVDAGATATYVNDAFGNRVEKTTGGVDSQYLYNLNGTVNTVFSNGLMQRMFVYMNGETLAEYFENTTYFAHTDHLGSTRLLTRLDQSVRESDDYYPYGELVPSSGGTGDIFKFTGKERDQESGNDDFGARYYASSMGRFLTPDSARYSSLTDPQSLNLYSYVGNHPTTMIDPDGRCWRWAQKLCDAAHNAARRFDNLFHGEGFRTDKGVEDNAHRHNAERRQQEVNGTSRFTSLGTRYANFHMQWDRWWESHDCTGMCVMPLRGMVPGLYQPTHIRVGRWMSPEELKQMRDTGRVVESTNGGVTSRTRRPTGTHQLAMSL